MKQLYLLLFLIIISISLSAQTRGQSPSNIVEEYFEADYPKAMRVMWKQQGNTYIVDFTSKGLSMRAQYLVSGTWIRTDVDIPESRIPAAAMNHYKSRYAQNPIISSGFVESPSTSYFTIDIRLNGQVKELRYDQEGNFIQ